MYVKSHLNLGDSAVTLLFDWNFTRGGISRVHRIHPSISIKNNIHSAIHCGEFILYMSGRSLKFSSDSSLCRSPLFGWNFTRENLVSGSRRRNKRVRPRIQRVSTPRRYRDFSFIQVAVSLLLNIFRLNQVPGEKLTLSLGELAPGRG